MAFGDLLEIVGNTGRFQIVHVTLLVIPVMMMASHNLLQNFVAYVPPHHCSPPTNLSQRPLNPEDILLVTVPLDNMGRPKKCQRYASPQWHLLDNNSTVAAEEPEVKEVELQDCIDGWMYIMNERESSIISDWDMVCDLRSLKQMSQTVYMGGVLVGSFLFGSLSDRYGRRMLLIVSYLLMAVCGTCAAFSTSFSLFCLFRFGCGMALSGQSLNSFSLILEWIPTHVRTVIGTLTGYCYTCGQLIWALTAYFVRDWRWLTLAVSLPFYVFFLISWWFHESSRWLILNHQPERAIKNLKSVARINGRHEEGEKIDLKMVQESMQKEMSSSNGTITLLDLFKTPTMRRMSLNLAAVWFSTSFAYYGLSLDLQKFGVDMYLIQVIFGCADIPAKLVITITMSRLGRRLSQAGALISAGICILVNLLVPYDQAIVRTSLAVVGKGCLAASFTCCYLYAGELYPTIIRQNGMGLVGMMARVGAMVAPMVLLGGDYISWLPGLIYGGAPILTGAVAMFLPETLGCSLPDTIQDVEDRGKGGKPKKSKDVAAVQDNLLKQVT
ncbi:solute carrier family 22 member 6 [Periophthalmus magnuspinnatus]|uniref:solute carrier family 22 member 6 n=1 Tax=Periophthalmus magnuspinnatus TaxID=409849 RepID=UPI00145B12C9|nr:solute carrier family 22 member 6 [Periophthalmus magnuspinnatus]